MLLFGKQPEYSYFNEILNEETANEPLSAIIDIAAKYHFHGRLWQTFVAWLIINDENAYSISRERRKVGDDSLSRLAEGDFSEFYDAFFKKFDKQDILNIDFNLTENKRESNLAQIGMLASELASVLCKAKNPSEFKAAADNFFAEHGVGAFGLNKAFHLENGHELSLNAAEYFGPVRFCDIWGYEIQKKELIDNTELFLCGKQANNVLLYGDSGTGKSTSIKALLNEYSGRGLRIVEVYKHQFGYLSELIDILKNRNYYFIIYMDDLSFEDFEIEYKYLKALIEGGLEPKPNNILIYATSNRRHLIKESHNDRSDTDDRHRSDTVQEKLSLAERFGVSIFYPKPISSEYNDIILHLAKQKNIDMNKDELLKKAHVWGMEHGRLSGRVAQQFINSLQNE